MDGEIRILRWKCFRLQKASLIHTLGSNFLYGRILCKYLGLEQKLQPLLDYGRGVHDDYDKTAEEVDYLIEVLPHTVLIYKMTDLYLA